MMRTIVRSIAVLALTAGLVAACGGGAAPTPTATPTGTPVATPTATPSVGPMDPAYVTGTGTLSRTDDGTTTADGDCTRVDGAVVESAGTSTDPRVPGAARVTISGLECGSVGFEWGR